MVRRASDVEHRTLSDIYAPEIFGALITIRVDARTAARRNAILCRCNWNVGAPEPGALALLGRGLVGLLLAKRGSVSAD
jgi:hypothetical protein